MSTRATILGGRLFIDVLEMVTRGGRGRAYRADCMAGSFSSLRFFSFYRVKVDHIPAHFQVSQAYRLIFISLPCGHFLFPARGYLDLQIW